jgi:Flp pilus assembly protein TadG
MMRRFWSEEEGFLLALGAVALLPLVLLAALVADAGQGWRARAELGAATRSAALAAAHALSADPAAAASAALAAGLAGRSARDGSVLVSADPASGRVEVVATARVPLLLGGVFGTGRADVSARASAVREATTPDGPPWSYRLGP